MTNSLKTLFIKLLRKTVEDIEVGNSELSDSEMVDLMSAVTHRSMSKAQACKLLNVNRSKFDMLVRMGKLPRGRKRMGFKELTWYQDELDEYVKRLKQ